MIADDVRRKNVLTKCRDIQIARNMLLLSATRPALTMYLPIQASNPVRTNITSAACVAVCLNRKRKPTRPTVRRTNKPSKAEIRRCVISIMVLMVGARGTTSPLQSGQWLPQPSPEPVARTTVPARIVTMCHTNVAHAILDIHLSGSPGPSVVDVFSLLALPIPIPPVNIPRTAGHSMGISA